MAKLQVHLPAELHARVKAKLGGADISEVVRRALEAMLADVERREALERVVTAYETEHGAFTDAELRAIERRVAKSARRPRAPRATKKRAA